jgi:membrane associated rhomboid family serine protease
MIIPIGHEKTEVRRMPWITIFLIVACCVLFVHTTSVQREIEPRIEAAAGETLRYFQGHPYLELDARAEQVLFTGMDEARRRKLIETLSSNLAPPKRAHERQGEQRKLDAMVESLLEQVDAHPFFRYGFVRDERGSRGWLSHMFIHIGLMHLIGNMFLLFLAGYIVEEVWGRPIFTGLYLSAGLTSLLFFSFMSGGVSVPLVGASGAVSGVMGAFLVRYWSIRIRFWYWFAFILRGTFSAPAWLMLPLWFANEVSSALLMDQLAPGTGGGVAHWAHVGGFAYGVGVALVMRVLDIEARYINPSIESKVTLASNPIIDQAQQLCGEGRADEAFDLLRDELRRDIQNYDASLALWDVACELGRARQVASAFVRLIRDDVQKGELDLALSRLKELEDRVPETEVEVVVLARLASGLAAAGRPNDAAMAVTKALSGAEQSLPGPIALRLARSVSHREGELAARAARCGLSAPNLAPELRVELEAMVSKPPSDEPYTSEEQPMVFEATSMAEDAPSAEPPMLSEEPPLDSPELEGDELDLGASELIAPDVGEDLALIDPAEEFQTELAESGEDSSATPFELASTFDFADESDEGSAGFLAEELEEKPEY